jgi:hypothetical protein
MNKKNKAPILVRLWQYQSERVPLLAIITMAALTTGVVAHFGKTSYIRFAASAVIVVLYLIQIRTSDEKKDFEHDNKYYKDRPVQRGLVTLNELQNVGRIAIITQLLIYASFANLRLFLIGLLSQIYAYLTRKEFYIRVRLRKHLLTYNLLHQVQLIILFFAVINILQPTKLSYAQLLLFMIVNIATVELARKTLPANEDGAKDSYSARLGYRGVAIALLLFAVLAATTSVYILSQNMAHMLFIILPMLALIPITGFAYHYAINPNKQNQKGIESSAIIIFIACMLSLILGA